MPPASAQNPKPTGRVSPPDAEDARRADHAPFFTVVQVRPQMDRVAAENLSAQGYGVVAPRLALTEVRRGRLVRQFPPLFPGYLLVEVVRSWWSLRGTRGVLRTLLDGAELVRVPGHFVEDLFTRMDVDGVVDDEPVVGRTWRPGQILRVLDENSSFCGLYSEFLGMSGPDRCRVLFSMLGRATPTELSVRQLEPA